MHSILAARTDFSIGESILTVEHLIEEALRVGATTVALTDTMSVTAMIDFTNRAKKAKLKPIIGTRLRLTDYPTWRPAAGEKKKNMPREYFATIYALTEDGMKSIFRLLTLANSAERFYYVPKIGFGDLTNELRSIGSNDVALVMGDAQSVLEHPHARDLIKGMCLCTEAVYVPLIPIDTPYFARLNEIAISVAADTAAGLLLVRPALYRAGEADSQEIMTAITENQKITDGWFKSRHNRDMHIMSMAEMLPEIKKAAIRLGKRGTLTPMEFFKTALTNTVGFVNAVTYEWSKAAVSLPKMAPDEFAAVVASCKAGWVKRFAKPTFGHQPTPADLEAIYKPRLAYELSILKKLEFSGYFLLVEDIVRFAKTSDILVGPGRGSVGGSLVAYLMGITDCDPVRFGLMFERFINPDRLDLPDADLDFMGARRHEIVDYLIDKYGTARVAGVSNFGTLAAASAIRDVGRVTGISERDYSVSKFVPKLHGANVPLPDCRKQVPEINTFAINNPEMWQIMERLEGTVRNMSQHAAGIVVGGVDLVERGVVEHRKESAVMCWDKRIVEDQGLVKVDILGLRTLDLIDLTLRYIKERHGVTLDLLSIPLDQKDVLDQFADGKTTAIFQFESGGMRRLLKELGSSGVITFEDITAATALYRPGPMESGMMDSFYLRKQGNEAIDYDHPLMESVLEETFGVIVYQEQVMKISQVIAGYNGADADKLRKIMGKKQPEEMAKGRDKFCDGCVATIGATKEWAGKLFDKIEGFAGYGFNKSHSVEYTLISYEAMWLKVNYGVEFYAAALTLMDEDKLPIIIRDAKSFGITVDLPDINQSTGRFEIITDTRLTMPFQRIKGISEKTVEAILEARKAGPFTSMAEFIKRVEKRRCNVAHQKSLNLVGAFASIEPTQPVASASERIRDQIELLPGLISANVPVDREMHKDRLTRDAVGVVIDAYRLKYGPGSALSDGMPVKPAFGKAARFMLIADAPNNEEDMGGTMGLALSSSAVVDAMMESGFERKDVYWTSLVKRPKRGKQVTPEEIELYRTYLDEEIEILKPSVIVLLGSITVRTFMPALKGKASDSAGKVVYSKDHDANLVIGFNPGEIYHDPEKQLAMNEVFASVAELLN